MPSHVEITRIERIDLVDLIQKIGVNERNRFFLARTLAKYPLAPESLSSIAFIALVDIQTGES